VPFGSIITTFLVKLWIISFYTTFTSSYALRCKTAIFHTNMVKQKWNSVVANPTTGVETPFPASKLPTSVATPFQAFQLPISATTLNIMRNFYNSNGNHHCCNSGVATCRDNDPANYLWTNEAATTLSCHSVVEFPTFFLVATTLIVATPKYHVGSLCNVPTVLSAQVSHKRRWRRQVGEWLRR